MTFKIGVGVTTYRRPTYLKIAIERLKMFASHCDVVVVNDDKDDVETVSVLQNSPFKFINQPVRSGIASAKNACLRALKECDYIFLFDDDIFIKEHGWDKVFLEAHWKTACQHFSIINWPPDLVYPYLDLSIFAYSGSHGVCLFLTKEVVEKVGGFDENMGMWGGEHVSYSRRVFKAGLTSNHGTVTSPFIGIGGARSYFDIVDFGDTTLPLIKTMTQEERDVEVSKWEKADLELEKTGSYFIPL